MPRTHASRISRRQFLSGAGAAGVAAASAGAVQASPSFRWTGSADVIVCGAGAAGFAAAIFAAARGARVVVLEKAAVAGGTAAKSGGVWWVPNNPLMRRDGHADPKKDALAYMARCAAPQLYDPLLPQFGLRPFDYELLETYYDASPAMTEELMKLGVLQPAYYSENEDGTPISDYYPHLPENKASIWRALVSGGAEPQVVGGYIKQMSAAARRLKVEILLEHAVERLVVDETGRVVGVQASQGGNLVTYGARRGVIFGTGGFTHDPVMADHFLRGPIFGGCAVPSNTGDFVRIAAAVGAALGNMSHAWWSEVVVEQALEYASVPSVVFTLCGDSMLAVNRFGQRVYNEKTMYNERTQAHFAWDAVRGEYPNLLTFLIYDERVARNPGSGYPYPVPTPGFSAPYVITGNDLPQLASRIEARLRSLSGKSAVAARVSSQLGLAPNFIETLQATLRRFNTFAETGNDLDFQRGATAQDRSFIFQAPSNDKPNSTLYPIAAQGPYHCIILGAGTLDTKGGPVINANGQVLNARGEVIPGLYAAGNCVSSPARQGYWAAGATIGPAMTFSYLAAKHATTFG